MRRTYAAVERDVAAEVELVGDEVAVAEVLWLTGEMLGLFAEGKFYEYQYLLLLPPLCVLSAIAERARSSSPAPSLSY